MTRKDCYQHTLTSIITFYSDVCRLKIQTGTKHSNLKVTKLCVTQTTAASKQPQNTSGPWKSEN